jgi:hypothetical protein
VCDRLFVWFGYVHNSSINTCNYQAVSRTRPVNLSWLSPMIPNIGMCLLVFADDNSTISYIFSTTFVPGLCNSVVVHTVVGMLISYVYIR